MAAIQIENLRFCYPGSYDDVFQNLSLNLDTDWKLGLIGRNGRGKTTLLRLLMGEYRCEGRIVAPVQFEYFPCTVPEPQADGWTNLHLLCPESQDWEIERELSRLEIDVQALAQPFNQLSGGERTRVLLAALFLNEGRFPLIDEPTNHLDAAGRSMVAAYLRRKRGFILVSHDRAFLDGCVDHILALNRSSTELQAGNYSSWRQNFDRREAFEEAQDAQLRREIVRMKEAARRTSDWSERLEHSKTGVRIAGLRPDRGHIGSKSAKMMQRSKTIEARRTQAIAEKSALLRDAEEADALKFHPLAHHARQLVELRDVRIRYGDREICGPIQLRVEQGERIALEGANGCGKTSLLKLILGADIPHSGAVERASGLSISYVSQDSAGLQGTLPDFARSRGIDGTLLRTILRKLGFARVQFEKELTDLSAGQRKKLLIAASLCDRAHLYVWDEPLNYMDLDSRIQIEELIRAHTPTMLFVEHDMAFRTAVATRSFLLNTAFSPKQACNPAALADTINP